MRNWAVRGYLENLIVRFIAVATMIIVATIFVVLPHNVSKNHNSNYQPSSITNEQKGNDILLGLSPEDWTAIFTAVLALFTTVLALSTVGLWCVTWRSGVRQSRETWRALRVARQSAEAAKKSADIASRSASAAERLVENEQIANRPHIIIDHLKLSNILTANVSDGYVEPHMDCRASNRGASPAFIVEHSWVFAKLMELDPTPDYGTPVGQSYIVAPTYWIGVNRIFRQFATLEQARDICNKTSGLWLVVRIVYKDTFDIQHTMRAAYRLLFNDDGSFDTFIPDGPEAYWEYT